MKEETVERARKIKQLRQARKYAKHECAEVEKRMRVALGRKPYPAELMDDETFATAIVRYGRLSPSCRCWRWTLRGNGR